MSSRGKKKKIRNAERIKKAETVKRLNKELRATANKKIQDIKEKGQHGQDKNT